MTTFHIFEAAPQAESAYLRQQLLAFGEAIAWLEERGVVVVRSDVSENPALLTGNPAIQNLMEHSGNAALPVILMDEVIKLAGRYPSRAEMAGWAKLQHPLFTFEDKGGSCSGPQCGR